MKKIPAFVAAMTMMATALIPSAWAQKLEWSVLASKEFTSAPVDIAFSASDGQIIVLLENGEIQILGPNIQMQNRFTVPGATTLTLTPDGQRLLVGNQQTNQLQIIELAHVYTLPVGSSPVKGPRNAPVTLTVFDDFQCPYCARLVPVLKDILDTYPEQVRIVFKHFPLRMHKFAKAAAIASIAAREQGKFWEMHDQLFANYNNLDEQLIKSLAEKIGLNMERFEEDIKNPTFDEEVNADLELGQQVGVRGTPSLFLNGKPIKERNSGSLRLQIDRELAKLKRQ
ncbi:MAG: thioredoxin domain-containing protein [Deltaproteobacteria bacterium]|jgi:protein-disulfide isomerase|nr:thioredoxin domain-containing protein [Deltaproteobacteria bacterium]MBW2477539.1 thioredoxin domain-containing protein [Deltaproteobacteria bacterium]MBW2520373.1 thioredoxin domain-containing protein [Deltaproteobacteria bacterium]